MADKYPFRPVHRLHQASEFSTVFQYRRVIRGKFFDLHWRPLKVAEEAESVFSAARLGLVVPKRLARRAVMRNLMKRIARETFRQLLPTLPLMDFVLKLSRKPESKSGSETVPVHPANRVFRQLLAEDIGGLFRSLPQSISTSATAKKPANSSP